MITTAIGTKTMVEQSEVTGASTEIIRDRIDKGMPEELAVIPAKRGRKLYIDELHQMFNEGEAVWLDEDTEKEIHEIVETAETRAEAIKNWGFGPVEIDLQ
ncbi:MAG: hypothetical protein SOT60_10110 [Bilifractor sp.]|nr:hypothetical protein [Bilifractor sp.]